MSGCLYVFRISPFLVLTVPGKNAQFLKNICMDIFGGLEFISLHTKFHVKSILSSAITATIWHGHIKFPLLLDNKWFIWTASQENGRWNRSVPTRMQIYAWPIIVATSPENMLSKILGDNWHEWRLGVSVLIIILGKYIKKLNGNTIAAKLLILFNLWLIINKME